MESILKYSSAPKDLQVNFTKKRQKKNALFRLTSANKPAPMSSILLPPRFNDSKYRFIFSPYKKCQQFSTTHI